VPEADPLCTAHFCVHYVTTTPDAPPLADGQPNGVPDYVEAVAAALEDSYAIENGTLGWEAPLSDASVDGDARTDAYLARLGSGLYGYAAPDPGQGFQHQRHGYLVLDDDYASFVTPELSAVEAMQVTAAHEYNHVLQFAYDMGYEDWAKESAATWAEEKVFPGVNDYVHFVADFAEAPETPLTAGDYGLATWNHWLEARAGTPDVIRDAWEATLAPNVTDPPHFALSGYDEAVGGTGESPFEEVSEVEFAEFAAATPEWRASDAFPDAASYPDVERAAVLRVGGRARRLLLDHLSFALLRVKNAGPDAVKLKVRIEGAAAGALALVGRSGDPVSGSVTSVDGNLAGPGRATLTLPNPGGLERLTAVLVNADARITSGQNPGFHADDVEFRARVVRAG
jgi:hypothetical protein